MNPDWLCPELLIADEELPASRKPTQQYVQLVVRFNGVPYIVWVERMESGRISRKRIREEMALRLGIPKFVANFTWREANKEREYSEARYK